MAEVKQERDRAWPGVKGNTVQTQFIQHVEEIRQVHSARPRKRRSRYVWVHIGGLRVKLYCDTGSRLTIIPPELYREEMGKVVAAKCHLRAWGSDKYLDTKGMFQTTIKVAGGASKVTWVYVVGGTKPEPLLGDEDAEDLGVISFHPEGRQEAEIRNISVPDRLREAGIKVDTEKRVMYKIPEAGRKEAEHIVHEYTGSVFTDRIGAMKVPPIILQYEKGFRPTQPPRYPVPYHYQGRLATHLKQLTKEGVIEDVHPAEPIDCTLNLSISEKKTKGSIRMNIDARPLNKGAKHTKYHVPLPQEVRHQLEGARVFSELDMGNAFHQVPLHNSSTCVFQSHMGLHRMKRLFFGPTNSTGIFHHEVSKAFAGVGGCITIHDNILVFGKDVEEHNTSLKATLARAKDIGVTMKLAKTTICATEVKWFGRVYSGSGVSADPDKIQHIIQAGRPDSVEDVRSLLQAAAYNARFSFDHKGTESYEEVTSPLREMLGKGAKFNWTRERERSFQVLLKMMNDKAYLAPYNPTRKTHLVTDASPVGISASIYQEDERGQWLPVDHMTRALSPQEQRWRSQIDWESLAKSWGMMMFRHYLVGNKFTSWGDHQPLIPLYNDLTRPAPVRISKHRSKIIDLTFVDKYLPGKQMPADYNSRHPQPIEHFSQQEREDHMVDDGEDVQIMRVIMADLPPALTAEMIRKAVKEDKVYRDLKESVRSGNKSTDPRLGPYMSVFPELAVIKGLVTRGERIVIPEGRVAGEEATLREWVVDLGHSAHQGVDATKRLLRLRLWFPGMDHEVERIVGGCLPCQASVPHHNRDPLKPSTAPTEPWDKLYCDHWGPTRDKKHILVLVDALTRYPEAVVVHGTGAEDNIHAFSEIFSRHGFPSRIHSDNGAPFNGTDSHLLQQYFRDKGVAHIPNYSAEDPEATGMVEAFMKHLKKIFHTAEVAYEDPYLKLNDYLLLHRATPHPTTKKSPAELLFNRKFVTTLPDIRHNPAAGREDIIEARDNDRQEKERMRNTKDNKATVKDHAILIGDKVLMRRKTTKHTSGYDPEAYTVTGVYGTQVEAERDGVKKVRDSQKWKKVTILQPRSYGRGASQVQQSTYQEDPDIGAGAGGHPGEEAGQDGQAQEEGAAAAGQQAEGAGGQVGADADPGQGLYQDRPDIRARLRRHPDIIQADTPANRPARTRKQPSVYQSEVRPVNQRRRGRK